MTATGEWFYLVRPIATGNGWIGFAKRAPFVADGHAAHEPGPLWFALGATEAAARAAIEAETRRLMH